VIGAAVFSRDAVWPHRCGLLVALAAVGFRVRISTSPVTQPALAAGSRAVFVRGADLEAFPAQDDGPLRITVLPRDANSSHASLAEPVTLGPLARLLARHAAILVPDSERRALKRTLDDLGARGDGCDLLRELNRLNGEDLQALSEACAEGHWSTVARLAHRFKGTGGVFGCPGVRVLAERIEHAAVAQDGSMVGLLLPVLRAAVLRLTPLPTARLQEN